MKSQLATKWTFVAALIVGTMWPFQTIAASVPYVERPDFGIWDVHRFESSGNTLYERQSPRDVWTKLIYEAQFGGDQAYLEKGEETVLADYEVDDKAGRLEMYGRGFSFVALNELITDQYLVLSAVSGDDSVHVELSRRGEATLF